MRVAALILWSAFVSMSLLGPAAQAVAQSDTRWPQSELPQKKLQIPLDQQGTDSEDYRSYYEYLRNFNTDSNVLPTDRKVPWDKYKFAPSGEYRVAKTWDWVKLGAATAINLPVKDRTTILYLYKPSDLRENLQSQNPKELLKYGVALPKGDTYAVYGATSPEYVALVNSQIRGDVSAIVQAAEARGGFLVSMSDKVSGVAPVEELITYSPPK